MKALFACAAGTACGGLFSTYRGETKPSATVHCAVKPVPPAPPLSPSEFRPLTLMSVYDESPDTKLFRFAFPDENQDMNGEMAAMVLLRYVGKDGKDVVRPYTPVSKRHQKGFVEFLVKNYKDSKMGNHMHALKIGDTIDVKGPFVKFPYAPGQYKAYGMIAAGSGITPMFQLLREVLKEKGQPEVSLIYSNRRKEDVLMGSELNGLMEMYRNFSPYYVLSDPPASWMGGIGHVSKEMIKAFMPAPSRRDMMVLVCGPPKFMDAVCGDKNFSTTPFSQGELKGYLKELGYAPGQVYKF